LADNVVLAVQSLNQFYGGSHILRDVSLEVKAGSVTGVLGRNGVGKTTLLKSIMGIVPVRTGRVQIAGADMTSAPSYARVRAGVGFVPQGREIFPRLSVMENLRMGLAGLPGSTPIPQELFTLFPILQTMAQRRGGDLSGGQQQQLAIARALCAKPKVLILDEPTEGIQPNIIQEIGRVIRKLADEGMGILLVEQYFDFAEKLADEFVLMERGAVIDSGLGSQMQAKKIRERMSI
jgi:urea transport system ATP-binding protein